MRRCAAAILSLVLLLSACAYETGPPGQPSRTDVNPITGSRGGSGSSSAR